MVSLRRNNVHFCGESIITPDWILTAASCLVDQISQLDGLTAVVGTNTLNAGGEVHQVAQGNMNPRFNITTLQNDIALLKVATPIQLTSNVQSIGLTRFAPLPFTQTTLSGWGYTSNGGGLSTNLQYINLQTLGPITCALRLSRPINLSQVCTASPVNQGLCDGDGGGPLINAAGIQVGIASSITSPCGQGTPAVFTSVASYSNFIGTTTAITTL